MKKVKIFLAVFCIPRRNLTKKYIFIKWKELITTKNNTISIYYYFHNSNKNKCIEIKWNNFLLTMEQLKNPSLSTSPTLKTAYHNFNKHLVSSPHYIYLSNYKCISKKCVKYGTYWKLVLLASFKKENEWSRNVFTVSYFRENMFIKTGLQAFLDKPTLKS